MAARIGNITIDCDDVPKLAAFWSAVLGRPVDAGSSEFFASIGGTDGERREPAWYFNKVPEPKRAKNRVHIDLVDPDLAAVGELARLGATVIGEHQIRGHRWTVMQDPEGNEFCIAARSFTGWD
ncbi:MAG TPA: VOC family protein [Streptosporangiaceae bacterium]|nr:VOC family protein [Streptosporangiaceae bacterium]